MLEATPYLKRPRIFESGVVKLDSVLEYRYTEATNRVDEMHLF